MSSSFYPENLPEAFSLDVGGLFQWLHLGGALKSDLDTALIRLQDIPPQFRAGYCKRIMAGNVTEFIELLRKPPEIDCKRIDKDHYIRPSEQSGELHEYCHAENKSGSLGSVRRTLANIRRVINANCSDARSLRWVTLTYAENMQDSKRLYKDYEKFWKRFVYYCKKHGLGKPEYIAIAEPQGRGAWHLHCLFRWDGVAPFLDNNTVFAPLWGHGWTKIKAVKTDCDNLGAYFSAYLADMPLDDFQAIYGECPFEAVEKDFLDDDGEVKKKKFIKGGRLRLYPSGMNIIRTSRGIVLPKSEIISAEQAEKEKASAGTETFSSCFALVSGGDSPKTKQIISKSYYNSKRVESQ